MTEGREHRRPRLRWYLLSWFAGSVVLMVLAYTQLLEYYLELGIEIRTQSVLERTATDYIEASRAGENPELPTGRSLQGYLGDDQMPEWLTSAYRLDRVEHGELVRRANLDFDGDNDPKVVDTGNLCGNTNCELLFLYPYQLEDGQWLYLTQGVVGTDAIYDALDLTEQVAFVIGSLFIAGFILVSFLAIRSIDGPLRKLERWSAELSIDQTDQQLPDLRFLELDTLAKRLQFAFERIREGVNKEKLFLRHASHELRTPIAILSSNVELIDRLSDRPDRSEAERSAFLRQYRALDDVQLLMETLLWINRQSDSLPAAEAVDLRSELDESIEQYRYLLEAHATKLTVNGDRTEVLAPVAAVRMVLSNLVRNAFQYTQEGEVRISIEPGALSVENVSPQTVSECSDQDGDDYGFGLGLELVSLICDRFEWSCETSELPGGRVTRVGFAPTGSDR
jgi:hypothetical protein